MVFCPSSRSGLHGLGTGWACRVVRVGLAGATGAPELVWEGPRAPNFQGWGEKGRHASWHPNHLASRNEEGCMALDTASVAGCGASTDHPPFLGPPSAGQSSQPWSWGEPPPKNRGRGAPLGMRFPRLASPWLPPPWLHVQQQF